MDPSSRLDYALFQLTPTRTRCDLLVFSGGASEKLASGLLDPFLSHLRFAKDQISKGGYSIILRPDTHHPPWFTRSTIERFVRFVSTPEILERFASIEKEISHIESSIHLNDSSTSMTPNLAVTGQPEEGNTTAVDGITKRAIVPSKLKGDSNGDEATQEENSKLRLQRVLETRKAVLRREQAMAYARAFVAGFEEDHVDDLITFADAFGASRLREACMNFKDLCNKKHGDGLWMDELAAIEACPQPELSYMGTSGIMLTSQHSLSQDSMPKVQMIDVSNGQLEQNGSSDASTINSTINHANGNSNASEDNNFPTSTQTQIPMSWPNLPPQFMYNFQKPVVPQMHPYQGYPFVGMQGVPLYYPGHSGNVQLPPHLEESGYSAAQRHDHYQHRNKSTRKRDKSMNGIGAETPEHDSGHSDHGDSSSCSESDAKQREFSSDGKPTTLEKQKKRTGKKSSRMVVIRNINYISSKRREGDKDDLSNESSVEDDLIDSDLIKQKVEDVVDSLQKHQKSNQRHSKRRSGHKHPSDANIPNGADDLCVENNPFEKGCEGQGNKRDENWSAFQDLLMRDEESASDETEHDNRSNSTKCNNQHLVDVQDEYCVIRSPELVHPSGNSGALDSESKKGLKVKTSDSFVVTERDVNFDDPGHLENFECDENYCKSLKRSNCSDGELILSQRMESDGNARDAVNGYTHESSSVLKNQRGGDWFIITPEKSTDVETNAEFSMFDGDRSISISDNHLQTEKRKKDFLIDDSFVVPTRTAADDQRDSQWRTDISIVSDLEPMGQQENATSNHSKDKHVPSEMHEPDDLYMVLGRDAKLESVGASWTPEIDYSMDISFSGADKRDSGTEANGHVETVDVKLPCRDKSNDSKNEGVPRTKRSNKDDRSKPLQGSLVRSRSEIVAKNRRPTAMSREAVLKSKLEKEEENRKRMEELLIQRQKRISQRSSATCSPATSKNDKPESKTATRPSINDKQMSRPPVQQVKRLNLQKSDVASSIKEQISSGNTKIKGSAQLKSTQQKNISKKGDQRGANQSSENKNTVQIESTKKSCNAVQTSGLCTSADTREKLSHGQITSLAGKPTGKIEPRNLSENFSPDSNQISGLDVSDNKEEEVCSDQKEVFGCNAVVQNDVSLLHYPPSTLEAIKPEKASLVETFGNKTCSQDVYGQSLPIVDQDHKAGFDSLGKLEVDYVKNPAVPVDTPKSSHKFQEEKPAQDLPSSRENGYVDEAFLAPNSSQNHQSPIGSETKVNTLTAGKAFNSADVIVENENGTADENFPVVHEISEIEIISDPVESTPPPINDMNSEPPYSRKKWSHNEGHPATKGIKKLLMFGRKSRNTAAC